MAKKPRVIVVGGGLGGLWATMRLAERGVEVDLFSLFPVKRSHSCCAQGGINAVLDVKGGRVALRKYLEGGGSVPVRLTGRITCESGHDDGESQEFGVEVDSLAVEGADA